MAKKIRAIQQLEAAECGVACLAMILDLHGASIPLDELRSHCGTSRDGNSALQILQAAKGLGMMGRGLKLTLEQLAAVKTPLILHWNMNHFVVFERFANDHAIIVDPATGRIQADLEQLNRCFSGVALQLAPGPKFSKRARKSESIRRYWTNLSERKLENLALSHIVPSGWELHNARLGSDQAKAPEGIDYQNIRDDRVYSYFTIAAHETKTVELSFNASYQGNYYLPAVSVEAMYDATKHAQSRGQWVKVVKSGR